MPVDMVDLAFVVIPVLLVLCLAALEFSSSRRLGEGHLAMRRAVMVVLLGAAWMAATWQVGQTGVLRLERTPPPLAFLVAAIVTIAGIIAFGPVGRRLAAGIPIGTLVIVQGFRFPLELAMHAMYERGVMPEQMSYSGWNFDIVSGITALVVGLAAWRGLAPRWVIAAWNTLGLLLLLNIMTIGIASTPRFQAFGPDRLNVWVTYPPYVWLPAVMVLAALAGHLLIFRALRLSKVPSAGAGASPTLRSA